MRRRLAVAALLWAVIPMPAPAQSGESSPPPDSIFIRCGDCGVITSAREVQQQRSNAPPEPGGAEKPLVGLALYIPIGTGRQREDAYVGAVGSKEWQDITTRTSYEFVVRMDSGDFRTIQRSGVSDLKVGDRVRLANGRIERFVR